MEGTCPHLIHRISRQFDTRNRLDNGIELFMDSSKSTFYHRDMLKRGFHHQYKTMA